MRFQASFGFVHGRPGLTTCVSPSDPWSAAKRSRNVQRRYTEALRWGDLDKSARYVDSIDAQRLPRPRRRRSTTSGSSDYDIGEPCDLNQDTLAAEFRVLRDLSAAATCLAGLRREARSLSTSVVRRD